MEIDDFLLDAVFSLIDQYMFFSFPRRQTMEAQKVAVTRLDDMLLCGITEQSAYVCEVGCLSDRRGKFGSLITFMLSFGRRQKAEQFLRLMVTDIDDRLRYF